ncbi:ABC transporter ATP-binding protein [Effusibacillus consociatus]|uniref:ABC transporter ATP-binding protein n=1 Tax=Effusibacillus consociatus TaxID=1117041 RepID=A0ABV9PXK1_9BACL
MESLTIDNISKAFKKHQALTSVSLEIPSGLFGLLGPNGAGKTTLMRILATVMIQDEGDIQFQGVNWSKNADQARLMLGYLPQEFGAFRNITPVECLDYIGVLKGLSDKKQRRDQIQCVLEEVNLTEHADRKIRGFSGGMKRRLGIAQAILGNPRLVIVDEPTAGLDPDERIRFRGLLRRLAQDRTVILSTHIVEDIEATCDKVAVIKRGKATQFANLEALASLADNKVWNWYIPMSQYEKVSNQHKVISTKIREDRAEIRILSDVRPSDDAVSVSPTIEEGYLEWIKE